MASTKSQGSSTNGRDSAGQRLGIKLFGGQAVLSGGKGARSLGREKFVRMGGSYGGNGGKGGDVIFISDPQKRSLLDLTYRPHFYAEEGEPGGGSNKMGHGGKDLLVYVPTGTLV